MNLKEIKYSDRKGATAAFVNNKERQRLGLKWARPGYVVIKRQRHGLVYLTPLQRRQLRQERTRKRVAPGVKSGVFAIAKDGSRKQIIAYAYEVERVSRADAGFSRAQDYYARPPKGELHQDLFNAVEETLKTEKGAKVLEQQLVNAFLRIKAGSKSDVAPDMLFVNMMQSHITNGERKAKEAAKKIETNAKIRVFTMLQNDARRAKSMKSTMKRASRRLSMSIADIAGKLDKLERKEKEKALEKEYGPKQGDKFENFLNSRSVLKALVKEHNKVQDDVEERSATKAREDLLVREMDKSMQDLQDSLSKVRAKALKKAVKLTQKRQQRLQKEMEKAVKQTEKEIAGGKKLKANQLKAFERLRTLAKIRFFPKLEYSESAIENPEGGVEQVNSLQARYQPVIVDGETQYMSDDFETITAEEYENLALQGVQDMIDLGITQVDFVNQGELDELQQVADEYDQSADDQLGTEGLSQDQIEAIKENSNPWANAITRLKKVRESQKRDRSAPQINRTLKNEFARPALKATKTNDRSAPANVGKVLTALEAASRKALSQKQLEEIKNPPAPKVPKQQPKKKQPKKKQPSAKPAKAAAKPAPKAKNPLSKWLSQNKNLS